MDGDGMGWGGVGWGAVGWGGVGCGGVGCGRVRCGGVERGRVPNLVVSANTPAGIGVPGITGIYPPSR